MHLHLVGNSNEDFRSQVPGIPSSCTNRPYHAQTGLLLHKAKPEDPLQLLMGTQSTALNQIQLQPCTAKRHTMHVLRLTLLTCCTLTPTLHAIVGMAIKCSTPTPSTSL